MRLLKQALFIGWALCILCGLLIVELPNASWNHAVSEIVWVFSIFLVFATFGFCALVVIQLFSRLAKHISSKTPSSEPSTPTHSRNVWLRRFKIGAGVLLSSLVFVALLLVFIEHQIKSSPVYQTSVERAKESVKVVDALGQPVVAGWFVSGEVTESTNGGGHAALTIPLKGPKGSGTLRVEAIRRTGAWQLSTLEFVSVRDFTTNLLPERIN